MFQNVKNISKFLTPLNKVSLEKFVSLRGLLREKTSLFPSWKAQADEFVKNNEGASVLNQQRVIKINNDKNHDKNHDKNNTGAQ